MTIQAFLASRERAVIFADSAGYFMRYIRPWNSYEEFEKDIIHIVVTSEPKFAPVTKHCVVFQLDTSLNPDFLLLGEDRSAWNIAKAVSEYARDNLDMKHAHLHSPFTAYVIGYDKITQAPDETGKGIVVYGIDPSMLNSIKNPEEFIFTPSVWAVPSFWISVTTWEAREYLFDFCLSDFKNAQEKGISLNEGMNRSIDNFLKNGTEALDYVSRKWPVFMKPFRIAKLDKNGFKWIRNKPRERPKEAPNLSALFENSY